MMEENNKTREVLLQAVEGLSDDQLNQQVVEGKWSIMQVLEHLNLLEKVVSHMIRSQLENETDTAVEAKPIEELTLNRSIKIEAPSFLIPSNDYITLEDMKARLLKSRARLLQAIEGVEPALLQKKSYQHPNFGVINLHQWVSFVGLHERRHLQQIEELKERLF
ncbi:DinB family protein [Fredinandcohnia humi]